MKTFILFLFISTFSQIVHSQGDYWDFAAEIEILKYEEDFEKALEKSKIMSEKWPDSLTPFLSYVNLMMYNDEDEDDIYELIEIGDERFGGQYDWLDIQMRIFSYWEEYEEVVDIVDSMHKVDITPASINFLNTALYEIGDSIRAPSLRGDLIKLFDVDVEYAKTLVQSYANWGILDSAQMYLDQIFEKGYTDMEHYTLSAFIKMKLNDKIGACMDLQIARKKGYDMKAPWAYNLNCFNEDRSDPVIKNFMSKHPICSNSNNEKSVLNRINLVPKGIKNVKITTTTSEGSNTVIYEIVQSKGYNSYSYFKPNEGQRYPEVNLIPFCQFNQLSKNLNLADTNDISGLIYLPYEFEKCQSIWYHSGYERYEEIQFEGEEIKKLSNGQSVACVKFKMTQYYFNEITFVSYYWFSDGIGWVAMEDSRGTTIEVLPIQ